MYNYIWKIKKLACQDRENIKNIVKFVKWELSCFDQEGKFIGNEFGSIGLPDCDMNNFIDFQDLTEELVVSWVKNIINEEDLKKAIKSRYEQELLLKRNKQENINLLPEFNKKMPPWLV